MDVCLPGTPVQSSELQIYLVVFLGTAWTITTLHKSSKFWCPLSKKPQIRESLDVIRSKVTLVHVVCMSCSTAIGSNYVSDQNIFYLRISLSRMVIIDF